MRWRRWVWRRGVCRLALGVLPFVPDLPGLQAHHDPQAPVPSLRALKVDEPLTVDGALDEPFWARAEVAGNLIDTRTKTRAEQPTAVRVAYTRQYLYIAVECFDERMSEVRASERREDRSFTGDDWVEIHLDPPHHHRGKYAFFANPLGTKADANEGPSGVFNYGWTAEWDCAARMLADRWVFEMRIPFNVLNYERRDGQSWGFNVTRAVRRTDSTSFWSYSETDMYKPRHFGHLTGLDLADTQFSRHWEVTPYVSTRTDFDGDTDTFFKSGLDVGFRLTPSITTAWTINPDYGQVEADDDTIELRDTERFLPEKRLFFREGDELMRMPHRLYYSRRFTDIEAGAKVSGTLRGTSFTFLNLYGDVAHDGTVTGNSAVVRAMQNVRERSSVVYYAADSEFEHGHSRVGSADGYLFLTDEWRVSFQGSVAADQRADAFGAPLRRDVDYLGATTLIYSRYPWEFNLGSLGITKDFNPLLGYIPRRDIFGPYFFGQYGHDSDRRFYKRVRVSYDTQYHLNGAGALALHDHRLGGSLVFPNDLAVRASQSVDYHTPFNNWRTFAGLEVFASDFWKSAALDWATGEFEETRYHELRLGKPIKLIECLPIRYEYTIRFEDRPSGQDATVWLNRVVFDLFLKNDMWVKGSLQHRDHSVRNISLIFGWKLRKHLQWYVVFNNVDDGVEAGNSIFTKVSYTF